MESAGSPSVWKSSLEALPPEAAPALVPLLEGFSALFAPLVPAAAGAACLAVFDAGPGQLGGPRIAQIAVLLALARRAEAAGARFAWGILQQPGAALSQGTGAEGLRQLLKARTPHEASGPEIAAWRTRLEERPEWDEVWVVGAPRLGSPPDFPRASHLQLWDALDADARQVGVTLKRAESADEALLDLPEDAVCVRLLRAGVRGADPAEPAATLSPSGDLARDEPAPAVEPEPAALPEPHRTRGGASAGSRFGTALHRLTGRTALASRLSRAVGRRHAAYIRKMREMFETGDIDSALRHAIPLAAEAGPRRLPLRAFTPRVDLHIRPERSRPWSVGEISPDLHGELRRLYRDAFHRLEAQDRVEEAAFLLAEVLHAHEEAVSFLERHGRLRLAAEMAEARDLAPGLVVRQWFLAGDRQRGLRIAHRTGAFGDAVARLERSREMAQAAELRRLWAGELAAAGDYAAAVDTLWPLEDERHKALEWMDRAIDQGGAPAGRMLARKVALVAEPFEEVRLAALRLLESWRAEGAPARLAFADTLRRGPRTPEVAPLARAAVRAISRDSGRLGARMEAADFRHLAAFAGDGALRADALALPLPAPAVWITRDEPLEVEIAARDAGTVAAYEAAFLPNGLTAVALGEAGVRLLARGGRVVAELDQPAHRLVVSDHGDRAIALGKRGDSWRLARLDFSLRRAEAWCEARLDAFAPDYDGALWFVAGPDGLLAAETAGKRLDGAWGVRLPGTALAIARTPARCSLIVAGDTSEVWTYELPALTLRRRDPVAIVPMTRRSRRIALSAEGDVAEPSAVLPAGRQITLKVHDGASIEIPLDASGRAGEPAIAGDWVALPVHVSDAICVYLVHLPTAAIRAEITLGRATKVGLRLTPHYLTLADDRGRVVVLDLENGQVRRDFRV
ncbi:MAG TPA: hypothetical protein VGG20_22670 [Thermoanaerobaculia bacterium]|jgi:hypothetical protein